jgi:hypothetical protein
LIFILGHFNAEVTGTMASHPSTSPNHTYVEMEPKNRPTTLISTPNKPPPIDYSTYPAEKKPPPIDRSTYPASSNQSQPEPHDRPQEKAMQNTKEEPAEEDDVLEIAQSVYDGYLRTLMRMEKRMENRPRASVEYPDASIAMARLNLERSARVLEQVKDYTVALENERYELEMMRQWGY